MNNIKHAYIIAGLIILAILIGFVGTAAYISSRIAVAQAKQVSQDMKPVHQEAQQQTNQANASEAENQRQLLLALAPLIAALKQPAPQTPTDYARIDQMIQSRLEGLQVKTTYQVDPQGKPLPDAPSTVQITGPDASKKLADYQANCDITGEKLNSCLDSVKNTQTKLDAEITDHNATKKELAAAQKAMKGGSFWTRLKGNSKFFVLGGGIAAGAICGTGHCR